MISSILKFAESWERRLVKACERGDLEKVLSILKNRVDVNKERSISVSSIFSKETYKFFDREKRCEIENIFEWNILEMNIINHLLLLLTKFTPLEICIKRGHREIVKLLLEHGSIDVNKKQLLSLCITLGDNETFKDILDHPSLKINESRALYDECNALWWEEGNIEFVKLILCHKDLDLRKGMYNINALDRASEFCHFEIVRELLYHPTFPEISKKSECIKRCGTEEIRKLLLDFAIYRPLIGSTYEENKRMYPDLFSPSDEQVVVEFGSPMSCPSPSLSLKGGRRKAEPDFVICKSCEDKIMRDLQGLMKGNDRK